MGASTGRSQGRLAQTIDWDRFLARRKAAVRAARLFRWRSTTTTAPASPATSSSTCSRDALRHRRAGPSRVFCSGACASGRTAARSGRHGAVFDYPPTGTRRLQPHLKVNFVDGGVATSGRDGFPLRRQRGLMSSRGCGERGAAAAAAEGLDAEPPRSEPVRREPASLRRARRVRRPPRPLPALLAACGAASRWSRTASRPARGGARAALQPELREADQSAGTRNLRGTVA